MRSNKKNTKALIGQFEKTLALAEARAWSKTSLERPLNDEEYEKYKTAFEKATGMQVNKL